MENSASINWNLVSNILTFITILVLLCLHRRQYNQMERQLQNQNNQLKQNFFAEYTKRYQEIILHFPENINESSFLYENLKGKRIQNQTMRYMRVYFDLCSEEFFLYKHGHLDPEVWKEWEAGMKFAFKKPAFKIAWNKIARDTGYYTEFERFENSNMYSEDSE